MGDRTPPGWHVCTLTPRGCQERDGRKAAREPWGARKDEGGV